MFLVPSVGPQLIRVVGLVRKENRNYIPIICRIKEIEINTEFIFCSYNL
jgi:hypothetical protein